MLERQMTIVQAERLPLQDHCGIIAAFSLGGDITFTHNIVKGLQALQTRGYDGAGLCTLSVSGETHSVKGEGSVSDVFSPELIAREVDRRAKLWVGQVRYGTKGGFIAENVQPFSVNHESQDEFFVAHNGQFSANQNDLSTKFSDTYIFAKELEKSVGQTWEERIVDTVRTKKGAFSLIIGTKDALYLIRDARGIRPLVYGQVMGENNTPIILAASETKALTEMGASEFSEVMPGTIIKFTNKKEPEIIKLEEANVEQASCIFENVYLGEGGSKSLNPREYSEAIDKASTILTTRQRAGEILAREAPLTKNDVDLAIGIPGTGIAGGEAYARICGIPYSQAITDKDKQDKRTFMSAQVDSILEKVLKHFNFNGRMLRGKRVVLIDDSIVRGNVTLGLVRLLKENYGVQEVHLRILSPPIDKICFLGINTRKQDELIAARNNGDVQKIQEEVGANSLAYLSGRGLIEAITGDSLTKGFCMGCMAGFKYPIDEFGKPTN